MKIALAFLVLIICVAVTIFGAYGNGDLWQLLCVAGTSGCTGFCVGTYRSSLRWQ